jgi:hypothetical protein
MLLKILLLKQHNEAIPCEAIGDSANEAKNSYFNIFCLFQKCLHLLFQCNILISEIF